MMEPDPLQQVCRTFVRFHGRKLSYFSGCDYFRLASHPRVMAAAQSGVQRYGLNVAASRLTTGNHVLYERLESKLASFFDAPAALTVPSGYLSNLVAAQGLRGSFSHVLLDEWAHPSLADAAGWVDCPVLRFRHRDAADLARAVQRCGTGSRLLLLTDGMFSQDGAVAPLAQYLKVLPKDALLLVDDAHGAGVLGRTGKGTPEHCGISRRRLIQTITLSKAFGVYGGAILSSISFRRRMVDGSRLFLGSTPLPLPLAAAALQAIDVLQADAAMRQRLTDNVARVKQALSQAGLDLPPHPGPIVTLFPAHSSAIPQSKQALVAARIYPPYTRYPGAGAGGCFRFVLSSEHTSRQLDRLIKALLHEVRLGRVSPTTRNPR
jgi:7-keto-8-aminopelargonate synthetase-like enzyme